MKIASLLPSATEIVFALGLGDDLVGVTDECDHPAEAVTKPVVSRSALPQGRVQTARQVDGAVREQLATGQPLYVLDTELLRREHPDVILTQDLCRVCAVPSGQVQEALDRIGLPDAKVISLDPTTLGEVIGQVETVGALLDREAEGAALAADLRARVAAVKATATTVPSVSVFGLEWSDPPFSAGHWIPEMIEIVGGTPVLAEAGQPSRETASRDPHRRPRGDRVHAVRLLPRGGGGRGRGLHRPPGVRRHARGAQRQRVRGRRHVVLLPAGTASRRRPRRSWRGPRTPTSTPHRPRARSRSSASDGRGADGRAHPRVRSERHRGDRAQRDDRPDRHPAPRGAVLLPGRDRARSVAEHGGRRIDVLDLARSARTPCTS